MRTKIMMLSDIYAQIEALKEIIEDTYLQFSYEYEIEFLALLELYGWEVVGNHASLSTEDFDIIITICTDTQSFKVIVEDLSDGSLHKKKYIMNLIEPN